MQLVFISRLHPRLFVAEGRWPWAYEVKWENPWHKQSPSTQTEMLSAMLRGTNAYDTLFHVQGDWSNELRVGL